MTKLYIAVLETVPDHMVPTLVSHAVLGAHLKFEGLMDYDDWLEDSFKKVTVRVNRKEFDRISEFDNVYLGFESTVLDGDFSCIVVCPREDVPNALRYANLWKPDTSFIDYAFQDTNDPHSTNTAGLRVADLCYTAFMRAKQANDEDGGPTDWFTDTKPLIDRGIARIKSNILNREYK